MSTEQWISEQRTLLKLKAETLAVAEQKKYGYRFVSNSLEFVAIGKALQGAELDEFKASAANVIAAFPAAGADAASRKTYHSALSTYKGMLLKRHKIVPEGYYLAIWMPLGIAIGLPYGILFKNLAIGVALGPAIGLMIGGFLNANAKKKGLIIPTD
ncbi:hypothetical protein [Pedobacter sp. SYP-B3415]|uniref:hypothetical protein n=1 Tax=Pedobacter sp. SYP-B3415 TaxID=2496641 RepID=UPI00101B7153|nr:hypothetical protein [Pedobacter sp. SYP-B3415]